MNPPVAAEFGGLGMITLTRRLEWLLLIATILPCLILVVWVSINRASAWWLLGLSIVVAMLFVRFSTTTRKPVRILEAPSMPTVMEATLPSDDEMVIGVVFDGSAYAFPYRCLYRTPIVQLTDFDKRLIVIHSPHANSATVLDVTREVRATDLEYVAMPGNSTLVYNRKYGQFIVGITGKTDRGTEAIGVRDRVPTYSLSFANWRRLYPESKLMIPTAADADQPGVRLSPKYPPTLPDTSMPAETPIILIRTTPASALLIGDYAKPTHTRAGDLPIVLWRDRGLLRAFNRAVDGDLFLTYEIVKDKKGREQLKDTQTHSVWTYQGRCIEGPLTGKQLSPVTIEENVYWGVSREWFPDLQLIRQEK